MSGRNSVCAYLGLGGNLGDPRRAMARALEFLDAADGVAVSTVSSLYRTPAWGRTDQPDFLNAVARVDTELVPRELLDLCLSIEGRLRRVRGERWGPRLIDIDLLAYGDRRIDEPGLTVPHPRMAERAFVIVPLAELEPDLSIGGRPVSDVGRDLDRSGIDKLADAEVWTRV